jgi:hypothetical protein
MPKSKTHFEQVPLELVKKIAEENGDLAVATIGVTTGKPHRSPSLRKKREGGRVTEFPKPEINCSICNRPVAVETAKTDEVGQAVHDECYVQKLGMGTDLNSNRPAPMQNS